MTTGLIICVSSPELADLLLDKGYDEVGTIRRSPNFINSLAQRELGWQPRNNFEALIQLMVEAALARFQQQTSTI